MDAPQIFNDEANQSQALQTITNTTKEEKPEGEGAGESLF